MPADPMAQPRHVSSASSTRCRWQRCRPRIRRKSWKNCAPPIPSSSTARACCTPGSTTLGAIFHPALTLLNAGRIESTGGQFQFYIDGVTPSVARVLEVLDRERITVASALGIRAQTALEWLRMAYNARGTNLFEAIHNQPGYEGIMAPRTLQHRYITEEVPMSLVPIAALGQRYGVSVRGIDSVIRQACIVHRTDYWRRGRTLDKLGIAELSVSEVMRLVMEGSKGW